MYGNRELQLASPRQRLKHHSLNISVLCSDFLLLSHEKASCLIMQKI